MHSRTLKLVNFMVCKLHLNRSIFKRLNSPPRADSLEKTLMLGKIEAGGEGDNRGWDGWMASLTQWTWVWALGVGVGQRDQACCGSWGRRVRHNWETELNWTDNIQPWHTPFPISNQSLVLCPVLTVAWPA